LDGRFWLDWCILQFGSAEELSAEILLHLFQMSIFQSKSSSILLFLGLFQRRAGSEEVESLIGSEAEEERRRRGRRKAEEA